MPLKDRKVVWIENAVARAGILPGGGHLGSFSLTRGPGAGLNPLWDVPWRSVEPDAYRPARDLDAYGGPPEAPLLASIMGHNLCLDFFGPPSIAEEDAGLTVHGEAPVATWAIERDAGGRRLAAVAWLPYARLAVRRVLTLAPRSAVLTVETEVRNAGDAARVVGWQEHATFGPPFLEPGVTVFDASAGRGRVFPEAFSDRHRLKRGADFTWPVAPGVRGGTVDLRPFPAGEPSGDFTASRMAPGTWAWCTALNPKRRLLCGYLWRRADFPWLGLWDEHRVRRFHPWDGRTEARGMEFGVSPFPQGKAAMHKLKRLHGAATDVTLAAGTRRTAAFRVFLAAVPRAWTGVRTVAPTGGAVVVRPRGGGAVLRLPLGGGW